MVDSYEQVCEREEALKSWICEHVVDGYEGYARALVECGYSLKEIVDDLSAVADDDEIVDVIKEVFGTLKGGKQWF